METNKTKKEVANMSIYDAIKNNGESLFKIIDFEFLNISGEMEIYLMDISNSILSKFMYYLKYEVEITYKSFLQDLAILCDQMNNFSINDVEEEYLPYDILKDNILSAKIFEDLNGNDVLNFKLEFIGK